MRLVTTAIAFCALSSAACADEVLQLYFQPGCSLTELGWMSKKDALKFEGIARDDKEGRLCTAVIAKPEFNRLFGFCAISSVQLKKNQADDFLCAVDYFPEETRFEYRFRFAGDESVCMFACNRHK